MAANPKPRKGRYRRKYQRDQKAARFAKYFGSLSYVAAIHSHVCTIHAHAGPRTRTVCYGRVEAAHRIKKTSIDSRGWRDLLPLCSQHHQEQEQDLGYFDRFGIDAVAECDRYVELYGHRVPAAA